MKDKLDMIFSRKDEDIEEISRYKAAGRKEKEKIYEISMKKYADLRSENAEGNGGDYTLKAEGVERYSRPAWYRGLCAAAASVVLMGGVLGGIMLSHSSKVQPMDHSSNTDPTAITVEATTSEDDIDKNSVVDALMYNIEILQEPQYPGTDSVDFGDCIYFNKDEYSVDAGKIVNLTKYYYAVIDERLDSMDEVEDVLKDTFIYDVRRNYVGGDLSSYESGYDFKDDNLANRYISTFIEYNGKVYAQSRCEYNKTYAYRFDQLFNFSSYELVSSDFTEGQGLYISRVYFDENSEPISLEDILTCKRVYRRPDGEKVDAVINILPENDVWKVVSFTVEAENDRDDMSGNDDPVSGAESPSDSGEFAELQLHDLKIYDSEAEAVAAYNDITARYTAQPQTFKPVDVEKYTQQILDASVSEEYNTLENKSYVYHMMLNSKFYFNTAKGFANTADGSEEFAVDHKNRYAYEHFTKDPNLYDTYNDLIYYYDGKDNYTVYLNEKQYFYNEMTDEDLGWYDGYIHDDDRAICYCNENGYTEMIRDTFENFWKCKGFDSLYPGTGLHDFTSWSISGTEKRFGRDCVDITSQIGMFKYELVVDLRTGILISEKMLLSGEVQNYTEITDLVIDEPVEKIHLDITGYTDINASEKVEY